MTAHDPQMLKGVLSLLLLRLCLAREDYGYALVVRLQGLGFPELAEGTVYPALSRLESQGLLEAHLVRSSAGPARKYYRVTGPGREELARGSAAWAALGAAVSNVLTTSLEEASS
ncbi:MAG: PadR family transcriptional regulator [Kineosporiaceae bacterium]|jgi:PadR family transcriptional regulator PadR